MKGIMTVQGPVPVDQFGVTIMHEHVLIDLSCVFWEPQLASLKGLRDAPVTIDMLGLLRRRPLSTTLDNLVLADEQMAIEEVGWYWKEGGDALVDCTSIGIGRDPRALLRVSRATNLNVVMGSGCYVERAHPSWVPDISLDELADLFAADLTVGVEETGIRSGIIGEIGTSGVRKDSPEKMGHMTPDEEKVLRAAGRAAHRTGAAVSVHLDLRGHGAFRVIDVLEDEGVSVDRMVMGHMDQVPDLDYHRAVAQRGVYLEYDSLGREYYSEEFGCSFGHDTWRVDALVQLINEGFGDQLVLSQDIGFKMDLRSFGGNGYSHVLTAIIPMLRRRDVSSEAIFGLLVENPRRILTVDWDEELVAWNQRRWPLRSIA